MSQPATADVQNPAAEFEATYARRPLGAALDHLGVVRVSGADASSFLQTQFTNEVAKQTGVAALNGYCTNKGRLLATFVQWTVTIDGALEWRLVLAKELVPAFVKRLSMFVLRAKVKIEDISATTPLAGLLLADTPADWPASAYGIGAAGSVVRLADALGRARFLVAGDVAAPEAEAVPADVWRLLDIDAGIARVTQPTQEAFVPQMINFELVGGVNFKKGCYPGQEVVARSQYLGKLRRRSFLVRADAAEGIAAGAPVEQPGQADPIGVVVEAAPNCVGSLDLLIETTVGAIDGTLTVAGKPLVRMELPYKLPSEQQAA
ncbi:CAF17-like 4Fe-4S cluster assembly/insertion protein YgfZ [Derxia lacustris]|uniref:CAF17-like 4Fe-4S cluster assembly/insertion protein YgfZ n=1 Tax=Derxia lacustris TaxID=764842 RepID=UPI001592ED27|nr:folate-binding protein YgfZ [Derxia lacustris]